MDRRFLKLIFFSIGAHAAFFFLLAVVLKPENPITPLSSYKGRIGPLAIEWGSSKARTTSKSATRTRQEDRVKTDPMDIAPVGDSSPIKEASQAQGSTGATSIGAGDPYYSEVRARIQSHVSYPPDLARRRIQGQVQVALTLLANGSVASLDITRSSGSQDLDRLALDSVRASAPFPVFDSNSPSRKLELPIDFRLH